MKGPNRMNPRSLTAQIKDAEWQVLNCQRRVEVRSTLLARKIQHQLAAPGTVMLAVGIGFIFGEMTKERAQNPKLCGTIKKSGTVEASPLSGALSLITSIYTLYTALPIAWLINVFYKQDTGRKA